ncbi:hypothetical protein T10_2112 [Trichinella papuae]|uniref:Uncharacterized protein n=1 Tax=Trichinella papuae TaxID=268474 RepID=A0A0V1N239_9BILA|nr:hypothetical protein T10_2112 [Trichinella papuae]
MDYLIAHRPPSSSWKDYGGTLCLLAAEVAIVLVLVIYGGGRCCYLLKNIVLLLCLLSARMLPTKRELGKRGSRACSSRTDNTATDTNPQVDTGAPSLRDDRDSSPTAPGRAARYNLMN